jgi:hypothetical protein
MSSFDLSLRKKKIEVISSLSEVASNFINSSTLQHITLIINIVLSLVSALFVSLRLYTTDFIICSVRIDDCKYFDLYMN